MEHLKDCYECFITMSNADESCDPQELRVITTDLAGCYHVIAKWNTPYAILKLAPPVITTYYNDRPCIWYQVCYDADAEWHTIEYASLIEMLAHIKTKAIGK